MGNAGGMATAFAWKVRSAPVGYCNYLGKRTVSGEYGAACLLSYQGELMALGGLFSSRLVTISGRRTHNHRWTPSGTDVIIETGEVLDFVCTWGCSGKKSSTSMPSIPSCDVLRLGREHQVIIVR